MMIPKAMQKPITPANRTTNHIGESKQKQPITSEKPISVNLIHHQLFSVCFLFYFSFSLLLTHFFHSEPLCVSLSVSLIIIWVFGSVSFYLSLIFVSHSISVCVSLYRSLHPLLPKTFIPSLNSSDRTISCAFSVAFDVSSGDSVATMVSLACGGIT